MFNISYEIWKKVCEAYEAVNKGSLRSALQWYPFLRLKREDWEYIKSEVFYDTYIETEQFVLYPDIMFQTKNYIQKSDGSFRDASLVSPILYLVLQAVGKDISERYSASRLVNCSTYYSGDYQDLNVRYRREYDNFFNEINIEKENYSFYIKTDISGFFQSINVDKLIAQIDKVCNSREIVYNPTNLQAMKRLLLFAGNGRFPLIENSIASSYLATIVYLDEIDKDLYEFINTKVSGVDAFKMIRYVDDLYILISSDLEINQFRKVYTTIRNEYSSILRDWDLSINSTKSEFGLSSDINQALKKALYNDSFFEECSTICRMYPDTLHDFLKELCNIAKQFSPDIAQYNNLIQKFFLKEDTDFLPEELFNYYVYDASSDDLSKEETGLIKDIISNDISVLALDPKRLGTLVMRTKDSKSIKALLNELFKRDRQDKWNSYDTTIAITYLLNSEFKHIDLLHLLQQNCVQLYEYYYCFCRRSFLKGLNDEKVSLTCKIIGKDEITYYLYFLYLVNRQSKTVLSEFAYYKSFFDRFTADLAFYIGVDQKKPNYKNYYTESQLKGFYQSISGSDSVIHRAHKLRNANPITHASAEILNNDNSTKALLSSVDEMTRLLEVACASLVPPES